jgi:hypothetical protein
LLWLRNFVLTSAGFNVTGTENHDDALTAIRTGTFSTLLMCYSLARTIRQGLADAFRKHCRGGRIIAITNEPMEKPDFADAFVYGRKH